MPDGGVLDADVCIIGGGPAGLTLASELKDRMSVILLESGSWPADPADVEAARARSTGHPYFPVHTTRVRALGGTSNHWYHDVGFRARPLDAVDLEARAEVPHSGWPFDRAHLDSYYARAEPVCGVVGYEDDLPALDLGEDVVSPVFSLSGTDVFQRLGEQLLADDRTRVVLGAIVTDLRQEDGPDQISCVAVRTGEGRGFTVRARAYVLAAGGIDNARLLLASRSGQPAGLGNGQDLVGRFFMEHLSVRSGDWRPTDPRLLIEPSPYRAHDRDSGGTVHAKLSPSQDVVRRYGLLNCTFFVDAMDEARASAATLSAVTLKHALVDRPWPGHLAAHAATVLLGAPHIARTAARVVRSRRGLAARPDTVLQLRAMSEQAPNPLSRVLLDPRERDQHGVPRALLDWRLTELDRRSVRVAQDVLDAALQRAGLGRLERRLGEERPEAEQRGQWHHMGTTRMSKDPHRGVVDAEGRVHGVRDLWVAGSSVFPTGGYANPTLTLVALALRLADALPARLADLP